MNYLDFNEINNWLSQEPELTYTLRQQLFFEQLGTGTKILYRPNALVMTDWALRFYGEADDLDQLLAQLPSQKKYHFFGVPVDNLPQVEKHFQDIEIEEDCGVYTLVKEDFAAHQVETLDSLTQADAEFVNEHWTYRSDDSLPFFQDIINRFPSSAIRVDGQLAGWSVCYNATDDFVNLGSLKVLPQYRKRGFGRKLALDLAAKVLETGKIPLVHILDDNIASRTLSTGIGFKLHPKKIFWGVGIKR
ncbi:MAG: GNAT family N-acetyltransferase [Firmicutes bacterium]|nr:GNAT family N-acetyltransferase [Bacillota bacterium]